MVRLQHTLPSMHTIFTTWSGYNTPFQACTQYIQHGQVTTHPSKGAHNLHYTVRLKHTLQRCSQYLQHGQFTTHPSKHAHNLYYTVRLQHTLPSVHTIHTTRSGYDTHFQMCSQSSLHGQATTHPSKGANNLHNTVRLKHIHQRCSQYLQHGQATTHPSKHAHNLHYTVRLQHTLPSEHTIYTTRSGYYMHTPHYRPQHTHGTAPQQGKATTRKLTRDRAQNVQATTHTLYRATAWSDYYMHTHTGQDATWSVTTRSGLYTCRTGHNTVRLIHMWDRAQHGQAYTHAVQGTAR